MTDKTWKEIANDPEGTVYRDWEDGPYRILILRGLCSVNAYVGVKPDHPLYGKDYNDIDVRCHGGLTFAGEGGTGPWPAGYWWFGWDYAHWHDACFYDLKYYHVGEEDTQWTPEWIEAEVPEVLSGFRTQAMLRTL